MSAFHLKCPDYNTNYWRSKSWQVLHLSVGAESIKFSAWCHLPNIFILLVETFTIAKFVNKKLITCSINKNNWLKTKIFFLRMHSYHRQGTFNVLLTEVIVNKAN